jgi:hypothetical protein
MTNVTPGAGQGDRDEVAQGFDADLVEYVVIALPDPSAVGGIASALRRLVADDRMRILDLVLMSKDAEGRTDVLPPGAVAEMAPLEEVDGEVGGLLGADDVALAGEALPPRSTALVLVIEDTWAESLAVAVRSSRGRIVGGERIASSRVNRARAAARSEEPR